MTNMRSRRLAQLLEDKPDAKEVVKLTEEQLQAETIAISQTAASQAAIMALLADIGGNRARVEDGVEFSGTKFVVPEQYQGDIPAAKKFLTEYRKAQITKVDMVRTYDFRPNDVAYALHRALVEVFGFTGNGEVIMTPFGPIEPELVEIKTGVEETVQVPWNRLSFMPLNGHIDIGSQRSPRGPLGQITINAPKAFRDQVEGLFRVIEDNLRNRSIYRGKAIVFDEYGTIEFLDLSRVSPEDVVYSSEVMNSLETNLWVVLRNMELLRSLGQPVKRSVLLAGPYGTGKSLAGYLTGQVCQEHGITFIFVKPGADLDEAMKTAQLYAPAAVYFEDVDVLQSNDPERVSKLLDTFDGLSGKGKEVIGILTTNRKDEIHKGMLRPGRLDTLIEIGAADRDGVQKIIEVKLRKAVAQGLKLDVDFDEVYVSCKGYMPAFVGEVAERTFRQVMVRVNGQPEVLTTEDFVETANVLRAQFDLMVNADEIRPISPFQDSLREEFRSVMQEAVPMDGDGDPSWYVRTFAFKK